MPPYVADSLAHDQSTPGVERVADRLELPALDDRSYRVIRLANALEVVLIHDAETDKASASLDVNVGSFCDPEDMPGMAHAVEHLLFMGTKKYPVENAYSEYLSKNSGQSNAYTAGTSTNYHFEVAAVGSPAPLQDADSGSGLSIPASNQEHSPFYGALDLFAQFFVAPLFLSSTLERELQAVDSENKKNLQNDTWRLRQLSKSLSNPRHPYCHFSTGNLETLRDNPRARGVEIRGEFIKFYEKHYSANRMKLAVLGRESLDELEQWVNTLFSAIPNKNLPRNRWDDQQPLEKEQLLTQTSAKPIMDSRDLKLTFPFLDEDELYESQPGHYLAHLIGHEGPGSILAYIKSKGWANSLVAGSQPICPGSALFTITVRLTEDGLTNYQEVVKVIFQYISLLREAPPQEWILDELKGMSEVNFRFQQKTSAIKFTQRMAWTMQTPYPREWLLSGPNLIRKFDPKVISAATAYLRPDNFRMSLISQHLRGMDQKEKWYGTEYKCEKIPEDILAGIERVGHPEGSQRIPELHLPHKNEFIPSNLEVEKKEVANPLTAPKLVRNDDGVRVWWKKDDRFWVPKGNVSITLRNPLVIATAENAVKTSLYCALVTDALDEYSYDADLAGLEYDLYSTSYGLFLMISGYNDKMPLLLEKVLQCMRTLEVRTDRFEIIKERKLRGFRNWGFQEPYYQIGEFASWLTSEKGWITEQYLTELPHITAADVRHFYPQLLSQTHAEVLVHGNLHREDALKFTDLVITTLKPRPLSPSQWNIRRSIVLPAGSNYTFPRQLKDPANVNHCIHYFLSVGLRADRLLRAKLDVFTELTEEPAFDQLRTKEQLGYVVFTASRNSATMMGYMILIQSERSPDFLEARINAFLEGYGSTLRKMGSDDFERYKRSYVTKRTERLRSLDRESRRFWAHITDETYDFDQVDEDVKCIDSLTKENLIEFYEHYISPSSPTRSKLSVHLTAQNTVASRARGMGPGEQKEKLLMMLGQYLNAKGVAVDPEALQRRFDPVDVSLGNQESLTAPIEQHLREDLKIPQDRVESIMDEGRQLLGTVLPGLGIELTAPNQGGGSADGTVPAGAADASAGHTDAAVIEDVQKFKAGLQVSAGATPWRDLSDFEEFEAKL
ncbi:MAG: Insulinase (Peptidase M16) [Piccolia ochrophora]|nr:MAG: Insulinase (Peptidase M16) [Piccolia ochrophora]